MGIILLSLKWGCHCEIILFNEVRDDLSVRFRSKPVPLAGELAFECLIFMDDTVMHHGDVTGAVKMGMGINE